MPRVFRKINPYQYTYLKDNRWEIKYIYPNWEFFYNFYGNFFIINLLSGRRCLTRENILRSAGKWLKDLRPNSPHRNYHLWVADNPYSFNLKDQYFVCYSNEKWEVCEAVRGKSIKSVEEYKELFDAICDATVRYREKKIQSIAERLNRLRSLVFIGFGRKNYDNDMNFVESLYTRAVQEVGDHILDANEIKRLNKIAKKYKE